MTNENTINVGGSQWVSNQLAPNQVNSLATYTSVISGINGESGAAAVHQRTEKKHYSIALANGMSASIDPQDWTLLGKLRWRAKKSDGGLWYAISGGRRSPEIRMHRLIMAAAPGQFIDHCDGDGLNNRRTNLRIATNTQNIRNSGLYAASKRPDARFKGVSKQTSGKWRAQIMCNRVKVNLGNFTNEEDAAHCYDANALKLFGAFSRLNFPVSA